MSDDHERVYVLRLWDESEPPYGHRISLYNALRNERVYFGTLQALLEYLSARLEDPQTPSEPHLRS